MKLDAKNITVQVDHCAIVKNASFTLEGGGFVGLIGPNGAGKSTLLKAIVGVRRRDRGSVHLGDRAAETLSPIERARMLSYMPQDRRVEWDLPARAVVGLGRYPYRDGLRGASPDCAAAVERALHRVDMEALAERPFAVMSGGERARVLLARALAVEAPILFVDEPISGLDPYHQIHVMEILRDLANSGVGVLAVLHDLTLAARYMDRLILMQGGEIVQAGSADEVLNAAQLKKVYRVSALRGETETGRYVIPWARL